MKLTDKACRDVAPPDCNSKVHYDDALKGFGLRVTANGARSFVLNYWVDGRERRLTIGSVPPWTVAEAKRRVAELRQDIARGSDPLGEREARRSAPTVNELADRFETDHLPRLRPTSVAGARRQLAIYVRPRLGALKVADVTYGDVDHLHRGIATGKASASGRPARYEANRVLSMLSKMFELAIRWEMRVDNPVRGIKHAQEDRRNRFLSTEEIQQLTVALDAHPERVSVSAIRLLLLTGARRGEALAATWSQFDLKAGSWTKPSSHTKQKKEHRVPLNAAAVALLRGMRADADREDARRRRHGLPAIAHVFPGAEGTHLKDVKKAWASVCRRAGIVGVRVHDLRHSYASLLASGGVSLPVIGALLGHTQASTTMRYAHLTDDAMRDATERAGAIVVPFKRAV